MGLNLRFMKNITVKKGLYLILALALFLRVAAFISYESWEPKEKDARVLKYDAEQYDLLARSLLEGHYNGNAFWAPGYPVYVSAVYAVFGTHPWVVLLTHCLIGTLSVWLIFLIGRDIFSAKTGLIAALLMAVEPHQILYTQVFYTETLFIAVFLGSSYFILRFMRDEKLLYLIFSAILLAFAVYIRPAGNYLFVVWSIVLIYRFYKNWRQALKFVLTLNVLILLVMSPWFYRNYTLHGNFGHTTNGGYNILYVFAASIYENQYGIEKEVVLDSLWREVQRSGKDISNPFVLDQVEKEIGMKIIKDHPVEYMVNHFYGSTNIYLSLSTNLLAVVLQIPDEILIKPKGSMHFSHIDDFIEAKAPSLLLGGLLILLFLLFTYTLGIKGGINLYRDGRKVELLFFVLIILYFTLIIGPLGSSVRFKLPLTPFYLLMAAYAVDRISKALEEGTSIKNAILS